MNTASGTGLGWWPVSGSIGSVAVVLSALIRVVALFRSGFGHAVLDVIACHARGGWARLSLDTIANEVGIDRSKVCLCIRSLEKKGVVEVVRRGGRGLANAYRVIPDAEAVPPAAQATAAENSAVFGTETTARNSADCGNVSGENSSALGTVSNAKQCRFRHPNSDSTEEEKTPPSGESRARRPPPSGAALRLRARIILHGSCAKRLTADLLFYARCARLVVQGDDIGVFGREFRRGREVDR